MSEFLRALRSFGVGSLSRELLLAEVDRQLAGGLTDPVTMLACLDEEPARTFLPADLHEEISEKILGALGVSANGPIRSAPADATPFFKDSEASETVVSDLTETPADSRAAPRSAIQTPAQRPIQGTTPNAPVPNTGAVLKHRFKLVECLGEGGMGRVYKAIDLRRVEARSQDVYVAVKLLTRPSVNYSGSLALLQREAGRLQKLSHPNIVRVVDCDRDGQTVFMTMEYLAGRSLKQILRAPDEPKMTREEAIRVLEGIAEALSFSHRNDIVHGDLKPGNVIVTDAGEVKVIDFGIARAMAGSRGNAVSAKAADPEPLSALTPSYASPEMLEHKPPDPRDDVYALACIAYEMLTGEHPFNRSAATVARDAGLKLVRRPPLTRTQFKALAGGLRFDRETRTTTVGRFMRELLGNHTHAAQWIALAAGVAAVAAIAGAYLVDRSSGDRRPSPSATLTAGETFRDCETCPLMKLLAPGSFEQGSANGDSPAASFERPRHTVFVGHPLGFGVQEVTRAQFKEFVDATGRQMAGCASYDGEWESRGDLDWSNVGYAQSASHPAVCISWRDASEYVEWLSRKTGQRYRLPSASEWEYAARAGSNAEQPWAASVAQACASANVADAAAEQRYSGWNVYACNDGYVYTAPVGTFAANAFGLSDMFGNAFEWVQDCWHDNYQDAPTDGSAWIQRECRERELRGGSWFTTPGYVRAAYRNRFEEGYRSNSIGFRVVRELRK